MVKLEVLFLNYLFYGLNLSNFEQKQDKSRSSGFRLLVFNCQKKFLTLSKNRIKLGVLVFGYYFLMV